MCQFKSFLVAEQNIFDIISKQNETEVLLEAGRSLSGTNYDITSYILIMPHDHIDQALV